MFSCARSFDNNPSAFLVSEFKILLSALFTWVTHEADYSVVECLSSAGMLLWTVSIRLVTPWFRKSYDRTLATSVPPDEHRFKLMPNPIK